MSDSIFRKESIERLASPEKLDQLMQVVNPVGWVPLATAAFLVGGVGVWGFLGRIPITVTGQGVLIYPRQVQPLTAAGSGKILELLVQQGSEVKRGDAIARLDLQETEKQLQQQKLRLEELERQDQQVKELQALRQDLEINTIEQQRLSIQQRIANTEALLPILREKNLGAIVQERRELQEQRQRISDLLPDIDRRLEARRKLFDRKETEEGKEVKAPAITEDVLLQVQQERLDLLTRIANIDTRLKDLEAREADAQRVFRDNSNTLLDLQAQLRELDNRLATSRQQSLESDSVRKNQILEVKSSIAQLELQLSTGSVIRSQENGKILELNIAPGQIVQPGVRLGTIETFSDRGRDLQAISYFPIEDGKKIDQQMIKLNSRKEKLKAQVTPNTVRRERFGGIKGSVTRVSPFPITREGASNIIGNPEVVETISSRRAQLEVTIELEKGDTPSGYAWSSSQGPEGQITPGTTASVRVIVEEVPPITFVLPFLRTFFGLS
ncbi:MAG: NHLP bacteriocin system secretion protein [Cyanobacteria bacterium M5B4]|nr:MAG: NHLP bacteriocin system secretion protein [Cyanobacteria bacterium M5B4]